jgi:hypothetical protein
MTASPGFGGNSFGDFAVGGPHLHTAQFYSGTYDASAYGASSYVSGNCPGFGAPDYHQMIYSPTTSVQYRITIVGDDSGQAVTMICRKQFDTNSPKSFLLAFGLPDNEPLPLPINNVARLFCIGSAISSSSNNDFGNSLNNVGWSPGTPWGGSFGNSYTENNTLQGISQSVGGIPCSCVPALWTYGTGVGQFGSPIFDGSASDSPWANATELFPVDLINGTLNTFNGSTNPVNFAPLPLEPRVIGTIPLLRAGRANYDEYATTNDPSRSFQHMRNGVYIVWNGPQVVP